MNTSTTTPTAEVLEARLGAAVAAALNDRAAQLPHAVNERLRVARETALERARAAARQAAPAAVVAGRSASGAAVLAAPSPWWLKAANILPIALLVAGLFVIEWQSEIEQVQAAAEIDAVLLADDLPPDAYADPGFGEFLKTPPR
jgi:hypothetical protein